MRLRFVSRRMCIWATALCFFYCTSALGDEATEEDAPAVWLWLEASNQISFEVFLPDTPRWEDDVEKRLADALGREVQIEETATDADGWWSATGTCVGLARRTGLLVTGELPLRAVARLVQPDPCANVDVGFSCRPSPRLAVEFDGAESYVEDGWHHFDATLPAGDVSQTLRFQIGYAARDLSLLLGSSLAVVLIPVLWLRWRRNRMLSRSSADPAIAWFAYFRLRTKVLCVGIFLACLPTILFDIPEFLTFMMSRDEDVLYAGIDVSWAVCLAVLLGALTAADSEPILLRLRGISLSRRELASQGALGVSGILVPIACLCLAILSALNDMPLAAALLAGSAVGSAVFIRTQLVKSMGIRLEPLTHCPLRARIHELAAKAGLALSDVYVVTPALRLRMANAFAGNSKRLLLSDYLISELTKREVDAIVAHELAHLRRKHPEKLVRLSVLGILLLGVVGSVAAVALGSWGYDTPVRVGFVAVSSAAIVVGGAYFLFGIRRRYERQADMDALALVNDPEAFIAGLVALSRLNTLPLQWKKRHEWGLSHPSMMRRIDAIAAEAGLTKERTQRIIAEPDVGDEHYEIPAVVVDAEKVFNSNARHSISGRVQLVRFTLLVAPPVLAALFAMHFQLRDGSRAAVYLAGWIVAVVSSVAGSGHLAFLGWGRFESMLYERLARCGIVLDKHRTWFIGFFPDDESRVYDGFSNSDIGFLLLTGRHLCFLGDSAQFRLTRDMVQKITLGRRSTGWFSARRVVISWQDPTTRSDGAFCVARGDVHTLAKVTSASRALLRELLEWKAGSGCPSDEELDPALAHLPPPDQPALPTAPVFRVTANLLALGMIRQALWTFLVCVSFRLFWWEHPVGPGVYVLGASLLGQFVCLLPYLRANSACDTDIE